MNLTLIELFCGKGEVSRSFSDQGFSTFKIDKRKRKGTCMPDLVADILKVSPGVIPFIDPGVIWASPPCNAFSNASGNYYRDGTGYKENTKYFQKVLRKTLSLIEEIKPSWYFIENPRGSLRYNKLMIDFLARTSGTIKSCTLSSYGFPTTKPTDIFTNCGAVKLLPMDPFGRGAKVTRHSFNNLTVVQRQSTPYNLSATICTQVLNYSRLNGSNTLI